MTVHHNSEPAREAVAQWRYSINYSPDGEANYANVHAADGQFVGNLRTHHAIAICNAFAVCEKLASPPAPDAGGLEAVREALAEELRQFVGNYWRIKTAAATNPFFMHEHHARLIERTIAALASPAATSEEGSLAQRNLMDGWAAMRMIREAVETLGPIGAMPAEEHLVGPTFLHEADAIVAGIVAMRAPPAPAESAQVKFSIGDRVRKTKGSRWQGRVVGTYSTALTPEGYAVESETEVGSVQIYPASALDLATDAEE